MSDYIKEFTFKEKPEDFTYVEGEPLKLNEDFKFYHNKLKFRKKLNSLQYLFKDYIQTTLQAAGIRDTYLKLEYTKRYLMVIFTDPETIKTTDQIIEDHKDIPLKDGCYYMESNSDYLLLLTKDMDGISEGVQIMEEILRQVLDEYFTRKEFDKFIKVRPFKLSNCNLVS
jgi:hypothetical protein